eukprot:1766897-Amphidinium_carterae.1
MHSGYLPSIKKWRDIIGVDLKSSASALRDIYSIVENAVADARAANRAIDPHPACQVSAMLQTLYSSIKGNARRTSELLNMAPGWGIPPSTRLHKVVVKLVPQISSMQEQAQKMLQESEQLAPDVCKTDWATFMYSAWRKLRCIPP